MEFHHRSVMLPEVIDNLAVHPDGVYVDGTFGGGGHTEAILQSEPTARVYAFDRDGDAVAQGGRLLEQYPQRLHLYRENYRYFRTQLALEKINRIDGLMLDLGISSHFVDTPERGFSFALEGDLDMRMDQDEDSITAFELVNQYPEEELRRIILDYGEEHEAGRIAEGIVTARQERPIRTTIELGEVIDRWTRAPQKLKAKARVFQALRIHVNGELEALKDALQDALTLLKPGGRMVVLSFQSLEDRIVKQFFQQAEKGCICPPQFPECRCGRKSSLKVITRKPLTPSQTELDENRRARSAKLRVAERKGAEA